MEGRKVGGDGLHDGGSVSADYSVLFVRKGRGGLLLLSGRLAHAEDGDEEATEADREYSESESAGEPLRLRGKAKVQELLTDGNRRRQPDD